VQSSEISLLISAYFLGFPRYLYIRRSFCLHDPFAFAVLFLIKLVCMRVIIYSYHNGNSVDIRCSRFDTYLSYATACTRMLLSFFFVHLPIRMARFHVITQSKSRSMEGASGGGLCKGFFFESYQWDLGVHVHLGKDQSIHSHDVNILRNTYCKPLQGASMIRTIYFIDTWSTLGKIVHPSTLQQSPCQTRIGARGSKEGTTTFIHLRFHHSRC
jgi:hypothetical protein